MARILLLEDDATFRDLVAAALKRASHEVTSCADGQMGWDMLEKAQPDLIVLDLAMPRLDGLSFLRRLRSAEKWNVVSVLVVSANSSAASIAVERGAQGYLLKSRFSMPELLETVTSLTAAAEKRRGSAA